MAEYEVDLSDGRTITLQSPNDLSEDQIKNFVSSQSQPRGPVPFGGTFSKIAFPTGGAVLGGEIGAGLGSLVAPGLGTAAGGILGSALGGTLGERGRQELESKTTGVAPPPFASTLKTTGLPFAAFGAGGELLGAGLKAAAPALGEAPAFLRAFTRPGTIAQAAAKGAAGSTAAGAVSGLASGQTPFQAIQSGVSQAPFGAALGAVGQAVPNIFSARKGTFVRGAEEASTQEGERLVQELRKGNFGDYLKSRGQEIWDKIQNPIIADKTPFTLKEIYDTAVERHPNDPEVALRVLKALGRDPETITRRMGGVSELPFAQPENTLASILESEKISPETALDAATSLSSKLKISPSKFMTRDQVLNADAKASIYDVLKSRLSGEDQAGVNSALKEYGEFAALRNRAISTFQPFGNVNIPTTKGIRFLQRSVASKITPQTPDDQRLLDFIKTPMGQDFVSDLRDKVLSSEGAAAQQGTARTILRRAGYVGVSLLVVSQLRKLISGRR